MKVFSKGKIVTIYFNKEENKWIVGEEPKKKSKSIFEFKKASK